MYRVLIVEDEKWTRLGIAAKLKKCRLDMEVAGEASNGMEALEMLDKTHADIVITDIKMPFMDGLDLIKETTSRKYDCKFIVISGYAEFEFAKQAMKMNVNYYLLKPLKNAELADALTRVTDEIEAEKAVRSHIMQKRKAEIEKRSLELEHHALEYILSRGIANRSNQHYFKDYPEMDYAAYCLTIVHIKRIDFEHSSFSEGNVAPIQFAVRNIIEKVCQNKVGFVIVNNIQNGLEFFILMGSDDLGSFDGWSKAVAVEVLANTKKFLGLDSVVGIGNVCNSDSSYRELFESAKKAVDMRFLNESKQVFRCGDMKEMADNSLSVVRQKFNTLIKCIESGNVDDAKNIVQDIFSAAVSAERSPFNVRSVFIEFSNTLFHFANNEKIDASDIIDEGILSGDVLYRLDTGSDIVNLAISILDRLYDRVKHIYLDSKDLVESVKSYIDIFFYNDLSRSMMAELLHIDPSYFSRIFKSLVGMGFVDYITNIRIKKAKELLKDTNISVQDIADAVGIKNSQYMCKVFKKLTGLTPMEYRQKAASTSDEPRTGKNL